MTSALSSHALKKVFLGHGFFRYGKIIGGHPYKEEVLPIRAISYRVVTKKEFVDFILEPIRSNFYERGNEKERKVN